MKTDTDFPYPKNMKDNEIIVKSGSQISPPDLSRFEIFLDSLGLPKDNILASAHDREVVHNNFPDFVLSLPDEVKRESRYLSKFAAATLVGLFDAALNYVWNEVVINLRNKASLYGLDLFYNSALGGKYRDLFETDKDLPGIKDVVLLDTCYKLELISEIIYKKLTHILIMRNDIGASHPNDASINAFELMGWLQICVQDVINDRPSESAIQVKALIDNLKEQSDVIEDTTLHYMRNGIKELSTKNVDNVLLTVFGIYVSPKTENILRKNVSLISPIIWEYASDSIKYKLGIRLDRFRTNLHNEKFDLGSEFLDFCDGNNFKTLESRIIEIDNLLEELISAHNGWDNFYHEVPPAREILSYIKSESDVPEERREKLIRIVMKCRIGNGVNYCSGVSPKGKLIYDEIINKFSDKNIVLAIKSLYEPSIFISLGNINCKNNTINIIENLRVNVVSEKIVEIIDYLLERKKYLERAMRDTEFKKLAASHFTI